MSAPVTRLARWHELTLYAAIAGLTLTGALWLLFHFFVSGDGAYGYVTHPLEPWWLKIHGAVAMFALVLLGSLIPNHITKAWQRRRNRITGGVNVAVFLVLAMTGYFLYYLGDETWRNWASVIHWVIGLGLPVVAGVHVVTGKRLRGTGSRPRDRVAEAPQPATGAPGGERLRAVRGGRQR